ncbi:MAG: hypothetical protein ACSHWN_06570 [Methylophilaceae bacterium]
MRDEGYWAFYLTALVYFVRYLQGGKVSHAIIWQLSMITATLFRIEGILFLLFLPLIVIGFQPIDKKNKLITLLYAYSISIIVGVSIVMAIILHPEINIASFGRLDEVFTTNLLSEFTNTLFTQADIMSKQVLGGYLEEFAIPGLLLTFLYVMGSKILTAAGIVGTALSILGIRNSQNKMPKTIRQALLACSLIAFIIMFLIITKVFVLSSRYVIALAWILLIFASFQLTYLSSNLDKKLRKFLVVICITLSLCFVKNILPKREGYNYAQEAVEWIDNHNRSAIVFYEDSRLRYYAGEPFIGNGLYNWESLIANNNNKRAISYDYLVISFKKLDESKKELIEQSLLNYKEIKRFYSEKSKKYIAIYQNTTISNHERKQ